MRVYAWGMASSRILLAGGAASLLLLFTGGAAVAGEPSPQSVVVNSQGEIVATANARSDSGAVYEQAFMSSPTERLKLEYVYRSHGRIPNPPNDPLFAQQWNFAMVGVPSAWEHADGAGVVVAVLDTGVNFTGIDGFCGAVVFPYDALTQTAGLADMNTTAAYGHGTHVAGTIAQCTNNGIGVAGIAPSVSLMPVRVLSDAGSGISSDVARGIDWAVGHGADVINMSLGADCDGAWSVCRDPVVDAAIERARAMGVVLVASSGNSASQFVGYPSSHPDVVSVGAVGSDGAVWTTTTGDVGSNQGSELALVAPGVQVLQETTNLGVYGYHTLTGTSMAAPHVSGAVALLLSANPTLSTDVVISLLTGTAVDIGDPGFDVATGWGRLDVKAAVEAAVRLAPRTTAMCPSGVCDSVAWVDAGGLWGLWDGLYEDASVSSFYFGNPGDLPFMGDWDGDGVATPGLYRQSDGFVYVRHSNTQGNADSEFFFGDPGDVPLVGDFDGDGRDSVSIWRPSEARVFVINELGTDGAGLGAAEFDFFFGDPGDTPFVGDFNGDGLDTVGLYRESTGFVYLSHSLTGSIDLSFSFGNPGDRILVGDWDGDGDDTVAIYRPSDGTLYVNLESAAGVAHWEGFIGFYPRVITAGNRWPG